MKYLLKLIVLSLVIVNVFGTPESDFLAEFEHTNCCTDNSEQCKLSCLNVGGDGTYTKKLRSVHGKAVTVTICNEVSAGSSRKITKEIVAFGHGNKYYPIVNHDKVGDRVIFLGKCTKPIKEVVDGEYACSSGECTPE